jgi:hypothetical protein
MTLTYFLILLFHLLIKWLFVSINPFWLLQITSSFSILIFFILVHSKFHLFDFIILMVQPFFLLIFILIIALFIICLLGHDLILILLLINLIFHLYLLIHQVLNLSNYCLFFELLFSNFMEDGVYLLIVEAIFILFLAIIQMIVALFLYFNLSNHRSHLVFLMKYPTNFLI